MTEITNVFFIENIFKTLHSVTKTVNIFSKIIFGNRIKTIP